MIPDFKSKRIYIENEFEEACFDESTGMNADELTKALEKFIEDNSELSMYLLRAKAFDFLMGNVQIEINPNTVFADKFNIGIDYSYFASLDLFQLTLFEKVKHRVLSEYMPEGYAHMKEGMETGVGYAWTDFWHNVPDWNNIIKLGFVGLRDRAKTEKQKKLDNNSLTKEQEDFYDSIIIVYDAIIKYLKRVYELSLKYDIPEYSQCVLNLTKQAPQNIYEVMEMSVVYVYMHETGTERARSLGPIDKLYYPYYKNDIAGGRYTEEEIKELFRYFFIHFTATKRYAQEPLTLCGSDIDGKSTDNELTGLILDVYDEMNIYDPKIHIRYSKSTPDDIMYKALDMIRRGNSSICILNDDIIIKGYEKIGVSREDAVNYVVLGCYEPVIMGKEEAEIGASWTNISKAIEYAMTGGYDWRTGRLYNIETPKSFDSFEDFYNAYIVQLDAMLKFITQNIIEQGSLSMKINPSPIYSSTFDKCMELGRDIRDNSPLEYNNISIKCFGLATVVDSLMAIKKFVFEEKIVSFEDMKTAIADNWQGHEELRTVIMNDDEKFGNNKERPDKLMCDIVNHINDLLRKTPTGRSGVFRLGLDSITNCIIYGKGTSATPDGRLADEPTSKNLCASNGMDKKGITALMNSLLKLDHTELINSSVLDFVIHPSAINGKKGLDSFVSLIKTYFEQGGGSVQGNIVDGKILKDAKLNPDKYKNLQIRVCGWNEYFVNLTEEAQDMFIKQTEEV